MKLAIITGASVGIGRATAAAFLGEGFSVYNLSRRQCPLEGVHNIRCDLSDPENIEQAACSLLPLVEDSESVALVHNASQMLKDSARDCDSESLRRVLETNVVAVNTLNTLLLPRLPQSSSVIYVGSTLSEKAVADSFSYVISKHAQLGMMRATCQDLMGSGIHTALVCPGFTDTEASRNLADIKKYDTSKTPLNRLEKPDDLTGAALFLASPESDFMTGQTLLISGGRAMH